MYNLFMLSLLLLFQNLDLNVCCAHSILFGFTDTYEILSIYRSDSGSLGIYVHVALIGWP